MAEAKQLLDLTISFNRNTIRIEGEDYEVRHPDEFGLTDFTWIRERSQKMFEIMNKGEMSVDEAGQADTILGDIIYKVFIDIPDEVKKSIKRRMEFLSREDIIEGVKKIGKIKFNFDCSQILKKSRILNEVLTQKRLVNWF